MFAVAARLAGERFLKNAELPTALDDYVDAILADATSSEVGEGADKPGLYPAVDARARARRADLIDKKYSGAATVTELAELHHLNAYVADADKGKLDVARLRKETADLTAKHAAAKRAHRAATKEYGKDKDWRKFHEAVSKIEWADETRLTRLYQLRAWHRGRMHALRRGRGGEAWNKWTYEGQEQEVAALRKEFAKK